jgi:hypothetical protein
LDIVVGIAENHSGNVRVLQNQTLSGTVFVWLGPVAQARETVDQVRFSLDGRPLSTEEATPFDLFRSTLDGNSLPFDTTLLADGPHTVKAAVRLKDGQTFSRVATFTISNGINRIRLTFSTRSNRSASSRLDGARITSNVYISLSPTTEIDNAKVQFYIDGTLAWTELYAPYDLGGTKRSGVASGYVLPPGRHTVDVVIVLPEGVTLSSDTATFTRT